MKMIDKFLLKRENLKIKELEEVNNKLSVSNNLLLDTVKKNNNTNSALLEAYNLLRTEYLAQITELKSLIVCMMLQNNKEKNKISFDIFNSVNPDNLKIEVLSETNEILVKVEENA